MIFEGVLKRFEDFEDHTFNQTGFNKFSRFFIVLQQSSFQLLSIAKPQQPCIIKDFVPHGSSFYFTLIFKEKPHYPADSLENIMKAARAAEAAPVHLIVVRHTSAGNKPDTFVRGTHGWELYEGVASLQYDLLVEKSFPSAFVLTGLDTYLKENKIHTVAIAGYVTQVCCDTTARYALHLGYDVEFIGDATATLDIGDMPAKTLYDATLATQSAVFSRVMTTDEWITALPGK
jgi:nicotinamidase-related amidase